ncbi:MAG: double-strand break repair protein AddB [Hyphomonadaceae bacterium]
MTAAASLFSEGAPRVFNLPPSAAFLDELARGLVDATGARDHPEALADALIFTPNQRAARGLALSLYGAMNGTMLTPEIRPLGDIEEEDGLAAFGPDALDLPPSLSPAQRRGALARLIQAWRVGIDGERLPPASLLAAADELGALIDQASLVGGVDWTQLESLAGELSPALAEHWQVSADFLDIVMKAWPKHLQETGYSDPQVRRLGAAEALAKRWAKKPPQHPVVIAGSTGAGAATRHLMRAVLTLPRGLIVFPGLDPDLSAKSWTSIAAAASHPQHTFGATLAALGLKPSDIQPWPVEAEVPAERARRRLINEALAPASETSDWNRRLEALAAPVSSRDLVTEALHGLSLVEAEDESEEALAAALLLRETLETPSKTAALVTPEASLARRTAAILERWGIDIAPSAGVPLTRTAPGSLLLILARWMFAPADPVLLLSVLKHACVAMGRTPEDLRVIVSDMERATLRNPPRSPTLEHLARRLATLDWPHHPLPEAARLIEELDVAHYAAKPTFADAQIDGAAAAQAIARLAETLCATPDIAGARIWAGKAGAMAAQFIDQLSQLSGAMGLMDAHAFPDFAEAAMERMIAAPDAPEHPRIAIFGPLEARLQRRDRMILASLNEGSWPKPAAADAFLNRTLRKRLGLPDPDERVGLSAHDFAQMANAPEVILLRARRVDDKPAVASRWLWRLRTLAAGGVGGREAADALLAPAANADPIAWARAIRHVDKVTPAKPPAPTPPVTARDLTNFSPSRVVKLIRDPYADYAQRVLRLEPLRSVSEDVDARERGTAVHKAIELFEEEDNEKSISTLIEQELNKAGAPEELIRLEMPMWERAGAAYLRWSAERKPRRADAVTEKKASIKFDSSAGTVTLKATADRVEFMTDGTLAIIDFKTGQPKKAAQVETGLEPQLALEAAIGARASFGHFTPAPASELIYFQISMSAATLKETNGQPLKFDTGTTREIAEKALEGLKGLIEIYANPAQPYYSKPRVEFIWNVSDYDRLARRAEWSADEGGDE